ncbi:tetratricopeptide repeat protein [Nocardia sp. alder85J]|uniref:tetratricopeptide repeat protein n=1 Tax=Nocardia sp. alder85J TaxID=2862949 RepID=UPI0022552BB1|nr:tetratricopeptide repeat protein [Nocardia sp. alder85J]MCX4099072.1 tetratricopeptide repeat protein [Nocardia sp. alder85J]
MTSTAPPSCAPNWGTCPWPWNRPAPTSPTTPPPPPATTCACSPGIPRPCTGEHRTLARIWRVTFDRITAREPFAVDLLLTLAWYAPDTIPMSLINELADPPTINAALGILAAYTMITIDPGSAAISIHRLVQAVARTPDPTDTHRRPDMIDQARDRATTTLTAAFPATWDDPATWPVWRTLAPHTEALADHTEPGTGTTETAALLNRIAMFLDDQGLPGRAIPLHEQALTDRERILGPDHPDTLGSRNNLASAHQDAGDLTRAIALYEQTLTDCVRVLGEAHPTTVAVRENLAAAVAAQRG